MYSRNDTINVRIVRDPEKNKNNIKGEFFMTPKISLRTPKTFDLYILTALAKGFPVFCSVLLPILYAEKVITAQILGYIGTLFIVSTIAGAVVVAKWLHRFDIRRLLQLASLGTIVASIVIFIAMSTRNMWLLIAAYPVIGLAAGINLSSVNAMSAYMTTRGNRFKLIAKLSMVADGVRIVFSLIVTGLATIGLSTYSALLIVFAGFIFLFYASRQEEIRPAVGTAKKTTTAPTHVRSIKRNRLFQFVLSLEFLDSFSSSQLFVFLPLLLLAKGYSLGNSLLLQVFTFLGYMSGRWLVGILAGRLSGLKAVGLAESGMVISIILLLIVGPLWALYALSFTLGVFARGTSPAIKSLAYDALDDSQMKQGSALHVIAGDSGSALGQLAFGLLVATFDARMPFIVAAGVASIAAILCLPWFGKMFARVGNNKPAIVAESAI